MNTTISCIRALPLILPITLAGTCFPALATEDCNIQKVGLAMILEPGGIAQKALSKAQYKEKLDVKRVRITHSERAKHPDKSRLTVVIDKKRKVKHIYCE
ncbi:hypothetical protein [Pseudomonas sp. D1-2]|uniref:hypothetical protein n=1 Tax=unclassified Pseudomonas TaxID=196821 RepID=UPI003DAA0BD7